MRCIYGSVRRESRLEGHVLLVLSGARLKVQNTCINIEREGIGSYTIVGVHHKYLHGAPHKASTGGKCSSEIPIPSNASL